MFYRFSELLKTVTLLFCGAGAGCFCFGQRPDGGVFMQKNEDGATIQIIEPFNSWENPNLERQRALRVEENLRMRKAREERETIDRAMRDLTDENPEIRTGAAKLLGKYSEDPTARLLLIGALKDENVKVRRAATVSLVERYTINSIDESRKLLMMLSDSDVEVRRSIANSLPIISRHFSQSSLLRSGRTVIINGITTTFDNSRSLGKELETILLNAFEDSDAIVRQNVLKNYNLFGITLTPEMLERRLEDKSREVLILALDNLIRVPLTDSIMNKVKGLLDIDDAGVRQKIALVLMNLRHPRVQPVLGALIDDEDPFVRVVARFSLAQVTGSISQDSISMITEFLLGIDGTPKQFMFLIHNLHSLGENATSVYKALTGHKNERVREICWPLYLDYTLGWSNSERWLPAIGDSSARVRRQIISKLRRIRNPSNKETVNTLIESPYWDVRIFAADFLSRISRRDATELIMLLLIDDNLAVRQRAIRTMFNYRFENWEKVLARSLYDEELSIQREAIMLLSSVKGTGRSVLNEFVRENPEDPLSTYVVQVIREIEMAEREEALEEERIRQYEEAQRQNGMRGRISVRPQIIQPSPVDRKQNEPD